MGLFRRSEQQRWDDSVNDLRDRAARSERTAAVLGAVGAKGTAAKVKHTAALDRRLADQQEGCPRNPRNGGQSGGRVYLTVEEQLGGDQ